MAALKKNKKKGARKKRKNKRVWLPLFLKLLLVAGVLLSAALIYIDAWLMQRFDGRKWAIPATVYARPMELYAGKAISAEKIIQELNAANFRPAQTLIPGRYRYQPPQLDIYLPRFDYWDGPVAAQKISLRFNAAGIQTLDADDSMHRLPPIKIGSIHPRKHEDRVLVSIDDVPASLIAGLLATEDRGFYQHWGISPRAIARAMWSNIRHGRVVEGGSTLTQQLVKNFFLNNSRSYSRKALEAVMAIFLELRASKDEILEAYINEVFIAQNGKTAIHGFARASEYLFAQPLAQLQPHQTALMVGMMKGPSYYNPFKHPARAKKRRDLVLQLMHKAGELSDGQYNQALKKPLQLAKKSSKPQAYPAYLDLVRRQLRQDYSQEDLSSEGLRIFTALNPQWQWAAQQKLATGLQHLHKKHGVKAKAMQGAVVVVNNATGEVMAVVGGKQVVPGAFNRALDARRPIGSLVKPAIYLTALEQDYHLASRLSDAPLTVKFDNKKWQPKNFDKRSHGDVMLFQALAKSYNIAAARLGLTLGLDSVASTLQRLGIEQDIPYLPSMLLGAIELSPLQVSQMYLTLASQGFYSKLRVIREVTDSQGEALQRYPLKIEKRVEASEAYLINAAMHKVMTIGTGRSSQRLLKNRWTAGKTGTSSDQRDSWFAGFDHQATAVVWLGRDDNKPLPVTASSGALPIWSAIMASQPAFVHTAALPENVALMWVDSANSKLAQPHCEQAVQLPFAAGIQPQEKSECGSGSWHWFKQLVK